MISVIIPFFNAKSFIVEAVNSCIYFKVVTEVLVIYDGCKKCTYKELLQLIGDLPKVKVIFHEDFVNLGSSASRNLGITESLNPYIAFLDADDYFLENRFDSFLNYINNNVFFDGIYEAIQFNNSKNLFTVYNYNIKPKELFYFLIRGSYGHFSTDGIILKKDILFKSGLFNESLDLHQDSELWLRVSYYGHLIPGNLTTPVSIARVHSENRIWRGMTNSSRFKVWAVTWKWGWNKPIGFVNKLLILRKLVKYKLDTLKE